MAPAPPPALTASRVSSLGRGAEVVGPGPWGQRAVPGQARRGPRPCVRWVLGFSSMLPSPLKSGPGSPSGTVAVCTVVSAYTLPSGQQAAEDQGLL